MAVSFAVVAMLAVASVGVCSAAPVAPHTAVTAEYAMNKLSLWLLKNKLATTYHKLKDTPGVQTFMYNNLKANALKFTILAPTDEAWRLYKPAKGCQVSARTQVSLLTLPGLVDAKALAAAPIHSPLNTVTAVPLSLASKKPLAVGVMTGTKKFLSLAKVVKADAVKNRYMVVHIIDRVPVYPC